MISLREIISEKKKKSEKPDFDRNQYYQEYLERLIPSDFKLKRKDNEIVITVPEN